jgi:hypothetical protein
VQPIASDDVAATPAYVTLDSAVNGIVEVAGSELVGLAELVGVF